jgi:dolichyl-phosphate-mannose--protein O-mannosyl transferase
MAVRRPHLLNAAAEIGFVIVALVLGGAGAPVWTVGALTLAMILYWFWSRRNTLSDMAKMNTRNLFGSAAFTSVLVALVLGGFFWLGRFIVGLAQ